MKRKMHMAHLAYLAPPAPPCFSSSASWIAWLTSAQEADSKDRTEPGPLIYAEGQAPDFNYATNFCIDCDARWRAEQKLVEKGRCVPNHLRLQEAES